MGIIHFVTVNAHRNKGYATLLANTLYQDMIEPMLNRYNDFYAYVTATGRAVPLMERTGIPSVHLIKQFYSEVSFKEKVVDYLKKKEQSVFNTNYY